ncbi:trihelix transcription factor ENAP2 [Salvia miltiorrhiza]|uniref:trihelix transcription factor ENAP2 n=1 Tax=Salvia miltiorrhiza TaxID=226208 RepID=UPI0025AC033F|nr:trihelix transcription factor ENAP2 [Salvia miltiorrhiza]
MSSQPSPSPPPSPSPSPRRLPSDNENPAPPASPAKPDSPSGPPSPPPQKTPAFPSREDCWSEEATRTLIEAWGAQYLHLNRGNLRQQHWRAVADAVNAAHNAKLRRTDAQCKNRIDTTKKKYKIEKSKAVQSGGRYVPAWPHFHSLDALIGDSFSKTAAAAVNVNAGHSKNLRRRISPPPEISPSPSPSPSPEPFPSGRKVSPAIRRPSRDPAVSQLLSLPWSVPVGPRSKRSGPGSVTERNFSVMAAAAAAMEAEQDEEYYDNDPEDESGGGRRRRPAAGRKRKAAERTGLREGYRMLAAAIMSLGETYEKVEVAKQRQMVEFEKQRMQFAKDLELLRAQVQLDNLKRVQCTSQNNSYL